ncbi:MAG: AAA family ATPase [Phocaeicola sp.]
MKIKRIEIRNFRGFQNKSFEFTNAVTVVVGNNTSGKSTLLKAVQVALGGYLKSLTTIPADKAYNCSFSKSDVYRKYIPSKKDYFYPEERTRIAVNADFLTTLPDGEGSFTFNTEPIYWSREYTGNATTHSITSAGELITKVKQMELQRKSEDSNLNAVFPLILSFGPNRIDNQYRAAKKTREKASRIATAYKSALKETVDFQSAFDWLYRYEQNIRKGEEFEGTKEAFINALQQAIPTLSEIEIDTKNNELSALVSVTGSEPVYQTFEYMSDGFKAIICIVAEIAHRSIALNGFLKEDAVVKTPGIVIIDELDLYLHPSWQRHILQDLQRAFPALQFIVSTHSPFIIQSVRSQSLISLDGMSDTTDPLYRSIEEIVATEMNMADIKRSKQYMDMVNLADKYYQLVKSGKGYTAETLEVKKELDAIEEEFTDNPAYLALLKAERKSR